MDFAAIVCFVNLISMETGTGDEGRHIHFFFGRGGEGGGRIRVRFRVRFRLRVRFRVGVKGPLPLGREGIKPCPKRYGSMSLRSPSALCTFATKFRPHREVSLFPCKGREPAQRLG
jgi:hypothetical protein